MSASLSSVPEVSLEALVGITSVAATMPTVRGNHCQPKLQLAAVSGALIHMSLSAPCNRNERIVVRHSGLSFAIRTQIDGAARAVFPAMKADALVAVYLADAHLVLGKVAVPEVADFTRYAVMWEWPAELELRVALGDKVLTGTTAVRGGNAERVVSLGSAEVQSPVLAHVYSAPGKNLGQADLTGELRITPATCGRTLRLDTVYSAAGAVMTEEMAVAVPLCGTAGDILQLKNLAPSLKLDAPK